MNIIYQIQHLNNKKTKKNISHNYLNAYKLDNLKEIHLENNGIPKSLYNKYLSEFKKKGVLLFSCFSEEEKLDDEDNEGIDMTDLNK